MNDKDDEALNAAKALAILRDSLSETQTSVRSYDTKAQIVGVGYAFALGIVAGTAEWFPKQADSEVIAIVVFWGLVMGPLILFGFVLHPTRKTAPKLDIQTNTKPEHILFIGPRGHNNVDDLKAAALKCDPLTEYAYETLKMCKLRELKRKRFIRALLASAMAFAALFAAHLLGALQ